MTFKNITQLLDYFKDEATCIAHLEAKRWGGVPACHHCGSVHVYRTNRGFKCAEKLCGKKFSVLTGTIYQSTKLPIRIWFAAIYLCTSSKKGISSLQAGRQLGITQKSAWHLLHRVRTMLAESAPQVLQGTVSTDETYCGGKAENKSKSKRKALTYSEHLNAKAPVVGLIEEGGKVVLLSVPWVTRRTISKIIERHIKIGSIMVTDSHKFYAHLKDSPNYKHEVVNHTKEEYVNAKGFTTNSIEGVFSILKRGLYGIYHSVSQKHLQKYCDEFSSRYNSRHITDDARFNNSLINADKRVLKYRDLIKDVKK